MGKYKVIVTARSFGSNSNKPYEVLKENGCEVIKLSVENGPIIDQLKNYINDVDAIIAGLDVYDADFIKNAKI